MGHSAVAKSSTTASIGKAYHIGASLKDLGKRWFAFSKKYFDSEGLIVRLNNDGPTFPDFDSIFYLTHNLFIINRLQFIGSYFGCPEL